jgi:hypothetical protein
VCRCCGGGCGGIGGIERSYWGGIEGIGGGVESLVNREKGFLSWCEDYGRSSRRGRGGRLGRGGGWII